ncbi:hypothetical protein GCM10007079_06640 [Nocardiopsis terrae]|uniref:Meckel syndrome type 1 protein n=1 Tax=Nocardiopsis terrae TaxID=372655 RepID=A0ABR9HPA9_9ACTN|nr:hypothetical protein [Nocardiopsis terrae]MBE1460710.1 hypothetical protein [Nocardiopsis terrae]GHC73041.1 hypothetical protein GCM10007079_06640 [Nocardiopsis terrae]
MSGYHGTVGAIGVRPAVWPEALRRALLLAGLLAGILFTVWLAAAIPAHAEEVPVTGNALPGDTVVESAETLGGSISGAVTAVGDQAARQADRALDGAAETARAVETEAAEPVQQVRETVRDTSLPRPGNLPEAVIPDPDQVTAPAPVGDGEDAPAEPRREQGAAAQPEKSAADERIADEAPVTARPQTDPSAEETGTRERGGTVDTGPRGAETVTTVANGTSAVGGGAAPAVAGYLQTAGSPAPAPGLFEAARHVLRSAPADSADEPTFSPD